MILLTGGVRGCSREGGRAWLLPGGHAWLLPRGACMVAQGGVHGCLGGHAWLLVAPGGMRGCSQGGVHGCSQGGMRGCSRGACVVFTRGGVHRIRRDTVNERAVHILLECILVTCFFLHDNMYRIITPRKRSLGKVIFLHLSVILFTKGSLYDVTSYLAAWSYVPSGGSLFLVQYSFQGSLCPVPFSFGGVSVPAPMLFPRGLCVWSHVPSQGCNNT